MPIKAVGVYSFSMQRVDVKQALIRSAGFSTRLLTEPTIFDSVTFIIVFRPYR